MCPRISVTSNQSRLRTVSDAFAIAPVTASSTLEVEDPVISIVLYTLSPTFGLRSVEMGLSTRSLPREETAPVARLEGAAGAGAGIGRGEPVPPLPIDASSAYLGQEVRDA